MAFNPFENAANTFRTQANRAVGDLRNQAQASVQNFVGDALNTGIGFVDNAVDNALNDTIGGFFDSFGFNQSSRSRNLPTATTGRVQTRTTAQWSASAADSDWRVKLSVPPQFNGSSLLSPLSTTGGLVFPYTPTIIIGHSANYNQLQPVHTNYPFQIYESSQTDDIMVTGEFTVENEEEGRYWVAAVHYLRSVTKMFYGDGDNSGSPPPLVKLNGYGDFVFNNVPCVVTNFTVDLPSNVDYIAVPLELPGGTDRQSEIPEIAAGASQSGTTWTPTQSTISVTVKPTYSRKSVSSFNLNEFVNGKFLTNGSGFI